MPRKQQSTRVAVAEEEKPAKNAKGRNGRVAANTRKRSDPDRNDETGSTQQKRDSVQVDAASSSKTSRAAEAGIPVHDIGSDDVGRSPQAAPAIEPDAILVPTSDEIKSELWRIATGDGSEASRVSALRALADIMGLLRSAPAELPEAMSAYMDALERWLARTTGS